MALPGIACKSKMSGHGRVGFDGEWLHDWAARGGSFAGVDRAPGRVRVASAVPDRRARAGTRRALETAPATAVIARRWPRRPTAETGLEPRGRTQGGPAGLQGGPALQRIPGQGTAGGQPAGPAGAADR